MPTYGDEMSRGFYLKDGGYYFAISDKMDLKLLGEIFTKGSWGLSADFNYKKRYKFSGNFYASYLVTKVGDDGLPDYAVSKDFKLKWSHRQDSKMNPTSNFSASVNFASTSYERNNLTSMYNPTSMTQSTRTSSVSYSTGFSSLGLSLSTTMNLAQNLLDFNKTFAFKNFRISTNPSEYEIATIDIDDRAHQSRVNEKNDFFTLFEFSAKWDWVPTMLTQNHTRIIHGFMGQTTAFRKETVKSSAIILAENKELGEVRYLHGEYGKGTWTFLGGHDPEDYRHYVGDPPTDLSLYPNSPGYRLILNNILFPAAKKEKHKT